MVSFPVHLMPREGVNGATDQRVEICDREPELSVGQNGKLEQLGCSAAVESILRFAVVRRRLKVRSDGPTVVLDGECEATRVRRGGWTPAKVFIHGITLGGWPDEMLR
ncbi:MAG TPA: hypothetical protein VMP41_10890 [Acidimicrobiales bacterium]|nr:hypothetical protein [Acidimicrobiales bacterium]